MGTKKKRPFIRVCPFCGEAKELLVNLGAKESWVSCERCRTEGPPVLSGEGAERRAIELWNNRKGEGNE